MVGEPFNRVFDFTNHSFFANGVPLTIGKNILMQNVSVYAGKQVNNAVNSSRSIQRSGETVENGKITLLGSVDFLYAGGKASGNAADSIVEESTLDIQGTVTRSVYGGGNAVDGGYSMVGKVYIHLAPEGMVNGNIYSGGYAEISSGAVRGEALSCFDTAAECMVWGSAEACFSSYDGQKYCITGVGNTDDKMYSFSEVGTAVIKNESTFPADRIVENGVFGTDGDGIVGETIIES